MRATLAVLAVALAPLALAASPWDPKYQHQARAMVAKMTIDEKITMVHGVSPHKYVGEVPANSRLNIPPLHLEDGPQGVADGVHDVTAWPSALTVVSTWSTDSMYTWGAAMGAEQKIKGTNIMLGPMMNVARVPVGGRNFESTGAEPALSASMVAAEILGIQSNPGVLACAKHFVDNNNEYNRGEISEDVPYRAQWELYYPNFMAAVEVGVGSIMCSYNRVNETYACENAVTLNDLKNQSRIGYDGFVMSDWGATHSTVAAALAGLDQQMPDDSYFGEKLKEAVQNGDVPESRLDDMVIRMLTPMYALGVFENPPAGNLSVNATSLGHDKLARELAANSTILAKNDKNLLPLDAKSIKSIAVIGDQDTVHGGGSGGVVTPYVVTPFVGINQRVNGNTPRPVNCSFVNNTDFFQPGNPSVEASSPEDCCAKCSAIASCNAFTFVPGNPGTCWLKPDDSGRVQHDTYTSGNCAPWPAGAVNVTYTGWDVDAAVAAAKAADVAIVVVATSSHEGSDRTNLSLPYIQDQVVAAVAAAQPKTVVNVRTPGALVMPWANDVPSILISTMPGQEAGNALADVLFGDVNPAARCPVTFPVKESDTWLTTQEQYPGVTTKHSWGDIYYTEELLIDYRWFDAKGVDPLFAFGHGLSYTTFKYDNVKVQGSVSASGKATVSVDVTNTGSVDGDEVPQLYLQFPASAGEPPQVLRGFARVSIPAGATKTVSFDLIARDCSIWDVTIDNWRLIGGTYNFGIGASSRDIRVKGTVNVDA